MDTENRSYSDKDVYDLARCLLLDAGSLSAKETETDKVVMEPIASDGSTRRFWRLLIKGKPLCILCAPNTVTDSEIREARAAYNIGMHLRNNGCAVPELFGFNEEAGLLVFEDLGDIRLHTVVIENQREDHVKEQYQKVVEELAFLQVEGVRDFLSDWCWDGEMYDTTLMQERESGYFLSAFWVGLLGQKPPQGVEEEFQYLAGMAVVAAPDYFLHRDFQSRNIMLTDGSPRFIDFQGGRFGPLGYDLASLLIDPYTGLSHELQDEILEMYLLALSGFIEINRNKFLKEYRLLALQRNLQIIGAFAFLSNVRQKEFFRKFVRPALQTALYILEHPDFRDLPNVKNMVAQGLRSV